ncbi:Similar to spopla: Speckle-type POZ protein-like A (Danio rerio) [Cotesia congregata]|uniref:Similar to spopla: Speckle-type POZ protein-like A (Danio rerio) n=1 Tax=Cotesia congregata TaxID=51543 RepID=A0A8J2EN62_COTCN|nr:Similar to spopla: Speckle-type POZ protein-like A (Danio rerio) [Cotesia congregata]
MSNDNDKQSLIHKGEKGYSRSEAHSITYTWEIDQISSFIQSAREEEKMVDIDSPKFSTGAKIKDSWYLILRIQKDNDGSKNKSWISIYVYSNNENREVRTKFLLFFLNKKKEEILIKFKVYNQSLDQYANTLFNNSNLGKGYTEFVKIDELLKKKDEFLQNDTLTVGVHLIVYDEYVAISHPINPLKASIRKLSDDFEDLLAAKKKCDVKIQVGKVIFDAHKLVLITRSCVFDAMFSHNMEENKKNEITISDVDPEVFKKVLDYIYTDKVDDLDTFAEELLEVSDKYQLLALKEICEDSLSKSLSVENSIRILILADRHNAKGLVEFTKNYIVVKLASLKDTEEYKALEESHPALFLALLKEYVDRYIYTDEVEDLDIFAERLLEASDKYQLQGLQEICEDFLAKTISIENAIRILILADRHNATRLKKGVINYVANNLVKFKNTEELKALEETQLLLFVAVLKKYSIE